MKTNKLILLIIFIPIPGLLVTFLFFGINDKSIDTAKILLQLFGFLAATGFMVGIGSLGIDRAIREKGFLWQAANLIVLACWITIIAAAFQILDAGLSSVPDALSLGAIASGAFLVYFENRKKTIAQIDSRHH